MAGVASEEVKNAAGFFKPHMPRFASAVENHSPELLVALKKSVTAGELTIGQLKRVATRFTKLRNEQASHFEKLLKAAGRVAKKRGTDAAVELMERFSRNPEKLTTSQLRSFSLSHSVVGRAFKRLSRTRVPEQHEVIEIPQETSILVHNSHGAVLPFHVHLSVERGKRVVAGEDSAASFQVSWSPEERMPVLPEKVSKEYSSGQRTAVKVEGAKPAVLHVGNRFSVGASGFEFFGAKGKRFFLRGVGGPAQGKFYVFTKPTASIGRNYENEIVLKKQSQIKK